MIRKYLHYRRFALLCWFLTAALLLLLGALGGLSGGCLGYGGLLALFVPVCLCGFDYFRFRRRLTALRAIRDNLSDTLHALPDPADALGDEYSALIRELYRLLDRENTALNTDHAARIEYYTLWLHQIKTPIAAMRLILDADPSPTAAALAPELFKIERYVDMALQYVKIDHPENDLVIAPCDLDALIASCVRKYSTLFIRKKLTVDFEKTGLVAVTDEKWLAFILEQLLSNAVKYTETGGVRLYAVGTALAVEDTGIGIRSEDIDRIFEMGYTGCNGRSDRRASGIGLHMARRIAAPLGIEISAERGRSRGARLFIELKAVLDDGGERNLTKL